MSDPVEFVAPELVADGYTAQVGHRVRLAGSRCVACNRVEFPARSSCPACAGAMESVALSQDAGVSGFTSVEHGPPGALVDVPYVIVVAEFAEGVAVLGQLVGATIDDVAIGDRLETVVVAVGERASYGFRRSSDASASTGVSAGARGG